jgi:lipopolysaccharide transport system permease protein
VDKALSTTAHPHSIVIRAGQSDQKYWRDVWRFRELLFFLAWRDVLVRYKQTAVGIAWVVIRPFLVMLVFTFVFSRIARLPAEGSAPYPVMVLAGLLPWQFFATAMSEASASLIGNANLITKVYFPRIIVPVGSVITSIIDFLVTLGLLALVMTYYGVPATWRILFIPALVVLMFISALGAGLWLAALNVKYRDFRYIVPFIVQFGLYVSPVGFSSRVITGQLQWIYALNPMVGVIDGFRWALLAEGDLNGRSLALSAAVSLGILALGIRYFRQTERSFADII